MSKKSKSNKILNFNPLPMIDDDDSPQISTVDIVNTNDEQPKKKKQNILDERFRKRKIPKVDDGIRMVNNKIDMSNEMLQQFYRTNHVSEFVKVEYGKYIKFEFGKMLDGYRTNVDEKGENDIIRKLSYAELAKKSFVNNINLTVRYINYFIEFFDDDDELMEAYFQLMYQIHFIKVNMGIDDFLDAIFSTIATESMVEKVIRMVEYNTDETLIKQSESARYDESIQLTVEHLKAIMGISCFHKFIIPIVSHYYAVRRKDMEKEGLTDKDLYYIIFASFIPIFDKHYNISLYGKLYHTATTRISKTENQEITMWKRRNRFGTTTTSFTNSLMRDYLNEISSKAVFNQSAIIFIHVCFDKAIRNELIQPDKYEMSDMKMDASDNVNETISRWDRWQMDRSMHSEKDRLRAYVSIKDSLYRMGRQFGIDFIKMESKKPKDIEETKKLREEFRYYQDNLSQPLNDTAMYIIQLYYASKLHSATDVSLAGIEDLIKLIMIMKRDFAARNYNYLYFFITGTLDPTKSKKYNKKKVEKLWMMHPSYPDLEDEYKDSKELMNQDKMLGELKTILACPITVVDYEYTHYRGHVMYPVEMCIVDEFMRLQLEL